MLGTVGGAVAGAAGALGGKVPPPVPPEPAVDDEPPPKASKLTVSEPTASEPSASETATSESTTSSGSSSTSRSLTLATREWILEIKTIGVADMKIYNSWLARLDSIRAKNASTGFASAIDGPSSALPQPFSPPSSTIVSQVAPIPVPLPPLIPSPNSLPTVHQSNFRRSIYVPSYSTTTNDGSVSYFIVVPSEITTVPTLYSTSPIFAGQTNDINYTLSASPDLPGDSENITVLTPSPITSSFHGRLLGPSSSSSSITDDSANHTVEDVSDMGGASNLAGCDSSECG